MNRKLPPDTFAYYVDLGVGRSYQAVAKHFGTSKQTVVSLAAREKWQERLQQIEKAQRMKAEQKAAETLEDMNERHLRTLQVVQRKALEALKAMPLATAMEAVRALDLAVRQERVIRGEPTERTAVTVEDLIRREYDRWMGGDGDGGGNVGGDGDAGDAHSDNGSAPDDGLDASSHASPTDAPPTDDYPTPHGDP